MTEARAEETKSLSDFEVFTQVQIFKTAATEPEFFKTHLVDPLRVIKVFKDDPNSFERIFYYQYLKLCTQDEGYPDVRIENMKIVLDSPEFYFIFPSDNHPFTDLQFKRLGIQFLSELKNYNKNIEEALKKYPIMDSVFCYLMRSLLILNNQAEECDQFIPKDQALAVLGRIFDVQFESFDKCTKFTESDVIVYEESPFEIYMVYLRYEPEQKTTETKNELRPLIHRNSSKKQRNQLYKSNTSNEYYDFVDYAGLEQYRDLLPRNNLFQSENLSLKSYSQIPTKTELSLFETFNMNPSQPKNGITQNNIEEILRQVDEDAIMEIEEIMVSVNQQNHKLPDKNQKLPQLASESIKNPTELENQLSGFESEEDAPKFMTNFPTTSTFSKLVEPRIEQTKQSTQDQCQGISLTSLEQNNKMEEVKKNEIQPLKNTKNQLLSRKEESASLQKVEPFFIEKYQHGNIQQITTQIQYTVKKTIPSYIDQLYSQLRAEEVTKKYSANPIVRLNVTKQFTNSFVLKQMPEIYQESIRRSRERARTFRKKMLQAI